MAPSSMLAGFINNSLTILCEASGTPPPTYSWKFNENPFEGAEGGNLTIDALKSTDSGTYICMAANNIGSPATASTQVSAIG